MYTNGVSSLRGSTDPVLPAPRPNRFLPLRQDKSSAPAEETAAAAVTAPPPATAGGKGGGGSQPTPAAAASGGDGATAGQGDAAAVPSSSKRKTFYVEPETLELAIGETTEVRVWAFPTEVKVYKDTLIACLTDNPRPVLFPVSCSGASPLMVLEGPWDKLLSTEEAALEELGSLEVRCSNGFVLFQLVSGIPPFQKQVYPAITLNDW